MKIQSVYKISRVRIEDNSTDGIKEMGGADGKRYLKKRVKRQHRQNLKRIDRIDEIIDYTINEERRTSLIPPFHLQFIIDSNKYLEYIRRRDNAIRSK